MEKYEVHVYCGAGKTEYKIKGFLKVEGDYYCFTDENNKVIGCFPIKRSVIVENTIWN